MLGPLESVAAPVRWVYLGSGVGLLGLGVLGAVTPLLPSTVFFILALWCFKRSSPRLEAMLLTHPVVGPTLQDWDRNRSIKPRTKIVAITLIWACLATSAAFTAKPAVWALLALIGIALTWYLATRKST